jgi:hypothetical protein
MKKFLDRRCGALIGKKPLNNQVVHLAYKYSLQRYYDDSEYYRLEESSEPCGNVARGTTLKDANGKIRHTPCLSDIGESCLGPIERTALLGSSLHAKTVEHRIVEHAISAVATAESVAKLRAEVDEYTKIYKEGGSDARFYMGLLKESTIAFEEAREKMARDPSELQAMLDTQCWTGGMPDPKWYLKLQTSKVMSRKALEFLDDPSAFALASEITDTSATFGLSNVDEDEIEDPVQNVTLNAGLGEECILVYDNFVTVFSFKTKYRDHESTCGTLSVKGEDVELKCYLPEGTNGEVPPPNGKGVCLIPRHKTCSVSEWSSHSEAGCRPGTVCKPNAWSRWNPLAPHAKNWCD